MNATASSIMGDKLYPSSVVMVAWPWEPQSLLGPETRAHATYHQPSCSSTGSSNIMAYFSLNTGTALLPKVFSSTLANRSQSMNLFIFLPGSTVVRQNVGLSQQIAVCLVVTAVRSQLEQLLDNSTGLAFTLIMFTQPNVFVSIAVVAQIADNTDNNNN